MQNNVGELVRKAEDDYNNGSTTISEFVDFSLKDNNNRIDAYLNSKHISGETDSLGRDKPFFNIITAAVNIWYRATDIDRKNIRIKATKRANVMLAFLASVHLQEFMRKSSFGFFLNEWGRTLARYGSAVVKFIEKDGELIPTIIPWNRLLVDPVDFDNDIRIEKLYFTPAQLRKQEGYDQEMVKKLLDALQSRKTLDKRQKDNKVEYIEVYEIHGELPLSYLTDNEDDEETFRQQMHVISFLATKEKGEFDDYTLYSGKEATDPYMITHLIKEDGRTQSIGAVEHLFEAQWMMNHNVKTIKDQLDLASKLIFQTSDGNFVGRNVLSAIEHGDILIHAINQPITEVNNSSHDISALQSFGQEWQSLGNQINGISEAMLGANPPSGSAWRQTQALLMESHSLFELMTENKGLYIEEMFTKYVIPFLKKQMDTKDEIVATLESYQVKQVDSVYIPNKAIKNYNEKAKESVLNGEVPLPFDKVTEEAKVSEEFTSLGNTRFFTPGNVYPGDTTWKEILKDLEWDVEVDITGEQTDNQAVMATYQTALQFIMGLQGRPMTQDEKMIFDKLLMRTGDVSPIELSSISNSQQMNPMNPAMPNGGQGSVAGQPLQSLTTQ